MERDHTVNVAGGTFEYAHFGENVKNEYHSTHIICVNVGCSHQQDISQDQLASMAQLKGFGKLSIAGSNTAIDLKMPSFAGGLTPPPSPREPGGTQQRYVGSASPESPGRRSRNPRDMGMPPYYCGQAPPSSPKQPTIINPRQFEIPVRYRDQTPPVSPRRTTTNTALYELPLPAPLHGRRSMPALPGLPIPPGHDLSAKIRSRGPSYAAQLSPAQRELQRKGYLEIGRAIERRNCSSQKETSKKRDGLIDQPSNMTKQRATNYSLTEVMQSRRMANYSHAGENANQGVFSRILVFDKTCRCFQVWDTLWDRWTKSSRIPQAAEHKYFTTIALADSIYILLEDQRVFRLQKYQWMLMEHLKHDHGLMPPSVAFNDEIYVIGSYGCNPQQAHRFAEKFNPRTNRWMPTTPMPRTKSDHALVATKDYIYCIGGKGQRSAEKFNPISGKWTPLSQMNICRSCCAAAAYDNKIYAMGGDHNSMIGKPVMSDVEVYDVINNEWTIITPMQAPRRRFKACVIDKSIFVIGGDSNSYHEKTKTAERFEVASRSKVWTVKPLPQNMDFDAMSIVVIKVPTLS